MFQNKMDIEKEQDRVLIIKVYLLGIIRLIGGEKYDRQRQHD